MTTPNLELPEWSQNQNQPNVTVNTALRILDCLCPLRVLDRTLTTPPSSPVEGDCYIPASGATGAWSDLDGFVVMYIGGEWVARSPKDGWEAWDSDAQEKIRYLASASPAGWSVI